MGRFVKHESCPKCGSRDNLARYEDGSAWCFGCHYREKADRIPVFSAEKAVLEEDSVVSLPQDACNDFPPHVVTWLGKYNISVQEALKHGWKYSPYWDQLLFPFYKEGTLTVLQARNFRAGAKTKYYNQGSPADVLPVFGACAGARTLVVVEDAVSAARIARQRPSMPCLGSYLPASKIIALKGLKYEKLLVWLDSDKLAEAREIETKAKWIGLAARTIYTELDPKEYSDDEINLLTKD